jgi:sporulation protein YqfC
MKGVVSVLKRLQKHAGEILEFPTDVLNNGPKITIIGRSEIIIEYFDEVVGFSDQEITLQTSEGKLCLNGDKFILTTVQDHEINIRGRLTGLSFGEG